MNGILTLQTGIPFSVTAGVDRSFSGVGLDRGNLLGPAPIYNDRSVASKIADYFDTAAFALPALGTFGNSGRNILTGPGTQNFDSGLFKNFRLSETKRFEIRWEVFNTLNQAGLREPDCIVVQFEFWAHPDGG